MTKPIIVVEPTVVEVATQICQGYDVAPIGPDLTPFFAHRVILWPDASNDSRVAFRKFSESLRAVAEEVKFIIPSGQPHGWNIAKAISEGWTWQQLIDWAKPRLLPMPKIEVQVSEAPDPMPQDVETLLDQLGISKDNNRKVINNVDNIVKLLAGWKPLKNIVWFDEFHQRYFHEKGEWQEIDTIALTVKIQREFGFPRINTDTVFDAIQMRGHECIRNEPLDWLRSLKWDGKPRVDRFFIDYMGHPEGIYPTAVSRNFWLSMVARVFQPGCQVDNMVILEGRQGIFKSKALAAIGGKWYMEASEEITSKDFFVSLQGKLLVEIADLDSFSRADTNRIKKVITCRTDRLRMPYARISQDFPRRSIFVGSTNESNYLRDNTGARRFWPLSVGRIELERILEDRQQLFGEAVTRYLAAEDWWMMPAEITLAAQENRRQFDEWENIVSEHLKQFSPQSITLTELAPKVGVDPGHLDLATQRRLGSILRRLGWTGKVVREGDFTRRVWILAQPLSVESSQPLPETV